MMPVTVTYYFLISFILMALNKIICLRMSVISLIFIKTIFKIENMQSCSAISLPYLL